MPVGRLWVVAIVCYPIALHAAIVSDRTLIGLCAGLILIASWQISRLGPRMVVVAAILLLGFVTYAYERNASLWLAYTLPVVINSFMCFGFARTLRPGVTPLITRVATRIRGDLPPEVVRYSRGVTWAWTGFFAFCAIETLVLALFAPLEVWSLFANVINYLLAALMFIVEYGLRRRLLANIEHPSFLSFVRSLWRSGLRDSATSSRA